METLEERCVLSSVAILYAGDATAAADVQSKVESTGLFSTVDSINVRTQTPTLAQLETYDSVLVYRNSSFQDPTALGNNLADYVDHGHGVVEATFANASRSLEGRWASGGYDVIAPTGYKYGSYLTLGTVEQPYNPIMDGVTRFSDGYDSYYSAGGLTTGSTLIASWSNGSPLVAEKQGFAGPDVSLNFYPPSSDYYWAYWDSSTDGALLMANALNYAIGGLHVSSTDPAYGSTVIGSTPTEYTVNVSTPLDPTTVDAGDFQVNGIDATGVSYAPGSQSLTFTFAADPVTVQGVQTMHIDAGAFTDTSGTGVHKFDSTFRWDAKLMQVSSTDPAQASTIQLPATTLDLHFNEAYDFSSAQPSDFTLNQGSVSAVTQVDASTLQLTLDGVTQEGDGTLTVNMAAGAMTDLYGNAGAAFSGSYILDFGSKPYPVPLTPKAPLGSLIYDPTAAGVISPAGDTDTFTISVDPGQTMTVAVQSDANLQASVTLLAGATGKDVVATGTASGAGQEVVVGPVATDGQLAGDGTAAKTYRIVVAGANETTGQYTVRFVLNAALEDESHGGASNDTLATAQSLEPSFVQLHRATNANNSGAEPARAAVLGTLEASSNAPAQDLYSFSLQAGESATLTLNGSANLELQNAAGATLALGSTGAANVDQLISNFIATASGTYYVRVSSSSATASDYTLLVTRNADFDTENNNDIASAQQVVSNQVAGQQWTLGNVNLNVVTGIVNEVEPNNSIAGAQNLDTAGWTLANNPDIQSSTTIPHVSVLGTGDNSYDYYSFTVSNAGDTAIFDIDHTMGFDSWLNLYDNSGHQLAFNDNSAPDPGSTSYWGMNFDSRINYTFSTPGTYVVRVARSWYIGALHVPSGASYTLQVSVQDHAVTKGGPNPDFYQVNLTEDQPLEVETYTPGAGAGVLDNQLDPMVNVYDAAGNLVASDDNSADDGRNALLEYYVPTGGAGTYYVEVTASDATAKPTHGEYILALQQTPVIPSFQVTDTSIANGVRHRGPTTQMTVDFNNSVLLTSLDASDLTVDGTPATGLTVVDANSVTFDLPSLTEGKHNVQIAGIQNIQNTPLESYNTSFHEDITPPTVVSSSIQENHTFTMSGSTQDVTETVTFSEPMKTSNLDNSDFSLHGVFRNADYTPASASYDATGTVLTLDYTNLPEDSYALTLKSGNGAFEDLAQPNGWNLDGEFIDGTLPSGDGVEGGDFVLDFSLDVGTPAIPTLTPEAPLGSLIYDPSVTGVVSPSGDSDSYTINVDAGQTISVAASPDSGLQPTIELRDPSNAPVGSATAAASGQDAVIQTVATVAGTYTITVGGDAGTAGLYSLQVTLNAALESESHGGPSNNTTATAQDINGSFIGLTNGADRGAVRGSLNGSADVYTVNLSAGKPVSVGLKLSSPPSPFGTPTNYSVGYDPSHVAYGDLNGDGLPDMVTANYFSNNATVRLNEGNGTFGPALNLGADVYRPRDVVLADVNNDHKLDIVLSNVPGFFSSTDPLTVMLGNGDGTFGSPIGSNLGYIAREITLADFNGDGYLDVAQTYNSDVAIGFGDGTGHFTFHGSYSTGSYPQCVAAADMNGDGHPDLVVASDDNRGAISTLMNDKSGGFGAPTVYSNGSDYTFGLAVGDVNGDGAPDVVTTNYYGGSVSVRLNANTGTGDLGKVASYSTGGYFAYSVAIGDVNGDGKVDLAVANAVYGGGSAAVLPGDGNGSFGSPDVYAAPSAPSDPYDVAIVDLNNDGLNDLSTANYGGKSVSVWLAQSLKLQLLNQNGQVVATATGGATNLDLLIDKYTPAYGGKYYVRIGRYTGADYSLVVTRNAVFDREANDTPATAQNFDGTAGALGYVGGSNEDWYSVHLTAGTAYSFPTMTPGDGGGQPVNTLDPHIVLYDASGTTPLATSSALADGRNEKIDFTPSVSGLYLIRVTAENGTSGEYFLDPAVVTTPAASSAGQVVASDASGAETTGVGGLTLSAMVGAPQSAKVDEADAGLSWGPNAVPLNSAAALPEGTGSTKSAARRFSLDDSADSALSDEEPFNPDPVFADYNSLLDELIGVQHPS